METNRLKLSAFMLVLTLALALVLTPSLSVAEKPVQGVDVYIDIAYTEADPPGTLGNLLDLYIPYMPGKAKLPLVIWSSGSAWFGDNGGDSFPAGFVDFFTQKGYAVAGVNVRRVGRLALAAQGVRDARRETPEGLPLGVDDVPGALDVLCFRCPGLHGKEAADAKSAGSAW